MFSVISENGILGANGTKYINAKSLIKFRIETVTFDIVANRSNTNWYG